MVFRFFGTGYSQRLFGTLPASHNEPVGGDDRHLLCHQFHGRWIADFHYGHVYNKNPVADVGENTNSGVDMLITGRQRLRTCTI